MLVSHRHQFIYAKTLKTAGTSVESYFEPYCMAEGTWSQAEHRPETVTAHGIIGHRSAGQRADRQWWNHMTAERIRRQLGDEQWARYYKFCVIRNPFDKALSMFYFQKQRGVFTPVGDTEPEQFEHWAASELLYSDRHIYVMEDRVAMDTLIRYESLTQDIERVCVHLGLPWQPERLPHFTSGFRPRAATPRAIYTARAVELVATVYDFELKTFGYRFDHVAPSPC